MTILKKWQFWAILAVVLLTAGGVAWKVFAADKEVEKMGDKIEETYSMTEQQIIAEYGEYGVTAVEGYGIALNKNSFPSKSSGEAVSTPFSWADKTNGKYTFDEKAAKKEMMECSLNPIWVSARVQALVERNDKIMSSLPKTKEACEKLKSQPLSYWLKDKEGKTVFKDGNYFLKEEYLQIALAMFRLSNTEFAFAPEYEVREARNPVTIWRKEVLTDAQDVLNSLKTKRVENYDEDKKWDDVLVVTQKLKDGTIVSKELFNIYDKAPIIESKKGVGSVVNPTNPTNPVDPVNPVKPNPPVNPDPNGCSDTQTFLTPEQVKTEQYVPTGKGGDGGVAERVKQERSGTPEGTKQPDGSVLYDNVDEKWFEEPEVVEQPTKIVDSSGSGETPSTPAVIPPGNGRVSGDD